MLTAFSVRWAPLLLLAMLAGCRSERLALAPQPPISSPEQRVVAETAVLPGRPVLRKAIFREPAAGGRAPIGRRTTVSKRASLPHKLVEKPVLSIAKQTLGSKHPTRLKRAPMAFARYKILFLSGIVVALASVVAALLMPTLGLGLLVGIGGVFLGAVLLFIGYADGFGRDPNGMT